MDERSFPQRNGLGVDADKNFFTEEKSFSPTVGIPHKPDQSILAPKTPKELPDTEASSAPTNNESTPKPNLSEEKTKGFENISVDLAPLRTYRQDVAGVMRDKKTSLVRLVLEEQKERGRRERELSPVSRKNLPLVILSVLFLFSTAGLAYYIYFHLHPVDRTLEDLHVTPLIFVEQNKEIPANSKDSRLLKKEIIDTLADTKLKVDVIEYLFFTETIPGTPPTKALIPSDRFFAALDIKMPPMLLRALRPDFMLGMHSFNNNQPFFILKTDYYDNAFAGMLEWENKLAEDILPVFGQASRIKELSQRKWGDAVIKNKDTRVLRNFDESTALIYAFKDQRTLIITTSEDTLLEVSRRLDLAKEKRPE